MDQLEIMDLTNAKIAIKPARLNHVMHTHIGWGHVNLRLYTWRLYVVEYPSSKYRALPTLLAQQYTIVVVTTTTINYCNGLLNTKARQNWYLFAIGLHKNSVPSMGSAKIVDGETSLRSNIFYEKFLKTKIIFHMICYD